MTEAEKREFLGPHGHLAYRYTMLRTHMHRFPCHHTLEQCHTICAFEASLLACRVFLEFLGLGLCRRSGAPTLCERREYAGDDDVKVVDLGGEFVTLVTLPSEERQLLADVYHLANKANAHLTHGDQNAKEAAIVHEAIPVIVRLLRRHVYEPLGEELRGHWYDQPVE